MGQLAHLSACCATETASGAGVHDDSRPGALPEERDERLSHKDVGCDTAVEVDVGAISQLGEVLSFGHLKARSIVDEH